MDLSKTIILGNSGSGKSWLAERISHVGGSCIDLGLIHWLPGGYNATREREEAIRLVRQAAKVTFRVLIASATAFSGGCAQLPAVEVPNPGSKVSQVVVLDIDGTLTPHDVFVFEARPDAEKVVTAYLDKGYKIVYVTTRIRGLQSGLASWLEKHKFPSEPIHIAQTDDERKNPAAFKASVLRSYTEKGWELAYAYGDSSADFSAYASAGIPQERIFALKRRGRDSCEGGGFAVCLGGWADHIRYVEIVVPSLK